MGKPATVDAALTPDEPVADGVLRVALHHVDAAIRVLERGPTEEAVHHARKSCKRARAVLDLTPATRKVGRRIRDAGRALAEVRDVDVVRALALRHRLPPPEPAPEAVRDRAADRALRRLRAARELLVDGSRSAVAPDALWARIGRSWKRARRRREADPHELRKAVKRVLHQLELIGAIRPRALPLVGLLDDLQERLGDHHDLLLLAGLGVGRDGLVTRAARLRRELSRHADVALGARADAVERWLSDVP